ncbi:MAG: hypothetical protein ACOX83_10115, partial [Candidatus Spyradocola sp.]
MKQQPMARKLLALALSLLLVLAFTPTVFAEGEVAQVGAQKYATVQLAIDAIQSGTVTGTIEMIDDSTENVTIPAGITVTLDLAGYTLTNKDGQHTITNNGTLIILDSKGGGIVDNTIDAKAALMNQGTATLKSGTLTRSVEKGNTASDKHGNSYYVVENTDNATLNIEGGTVIAEGNYSSLLRNRGTLNVSNGKLENGYNAIKNETGTVNISGGTIQATVPGETAFLNDAYATISGGEILSDGGSALVSRTTTNAGSTTIQGTAKITGNVNVLFLTPPDEYHEGDFQAILNVNGGTIDGNISAENYSDVNITGGSVTGTLSTKPGTNLQLPTELTVTGGAFDKQPADEYIGTSLMAQVDNDGKYYVGAAASSAIASAKKTVSVLNGNSVTNVPAGVTVTNSTGANISVNGSNLSAGSSTSIKGPFTEPTYYPDYDEDVDYLPPVEDEPEQ